ncbi:hypothetical protein LWC34_43125 [Kibdelosporangium philippinense]|uniref:HEAT repeat domain-containing protein n=1 Tax=Kibdelosporangium philippinense TaxID=211113 RepID=A0ABS8ZP81_9PSEU|nr:hypothetical protein [Kibdelosporangium philippinense]MCE7009556.1 hypothetical protein [Kibdelosporangium philippinense]
MEHEPTSTPERLEEEELPTGVFNFEKLPIEYLITLIKCVEGAGFPDYDDPNKGDRKAQELGGVIERDLLNFIEQSPDKAKEFFDAFIENGNKDTKLMAVNALAEPLAIQLANDREKQHHVINRWTSLLHDEDEEVRDAAYETLMSLSLEQPDWLDEPKAWEVAGEIERSRGRGDAYRSGPAQ